MSVSHQDFIKLLTTSAVAMMAFVAPSFAGAGVFERELERALSSSDQIMSTQKAYLSAREDVHIANSGNEWTSSLSLDGTRRNEAVNGDNFNQSDSRNLTLQVKKKLYDGGVSSAQESVAMLSLDLAMMQVHMMEESVLLEAVRVFTALSSARDRLRISTANLARLEEHLRASSLRVEIGESSATELSGTKARFARAKANLIQAESNLATAEATYRSFIGTPPENLEIADVLVDLPQSAEETADLALKYKPSHKISFLRERIARKTMDVLLAQIRPNLDLTLSGKTADSASAQMDKETFSATVMFSMPLYPSTSVFAKSRGAVADHQKTLFDLTDDRRTTKLNAENAFRAYQAADAVILAYSAELDAANAVLDGTEQEVTFGQKTQLDLLDAEQDVVTAQLNLLVARQDRVNSAYQLLAAAGQLTPSNLGLDGIPSPSTLPQLENPIVGPFPLLRYPE